MQTFLSVALAMLLSCALMAKENNARIPPVEIVAAPGSTHIIRIAKDKLFIAKGSTYLFTVDTPEDKGLVSTGLTATQLPLQLRSKDGSALQFKITGRNGAPKQDGELVSGDQLHVSNAANTSVYNIVVEQRALSGQLSLQKDSATINTKSDLTLYFTAGQRSPAASVAIYFPAAVQPDMNSTTVNVIGRGEVLLKDLSKQSIGRTGTKYSYSKVGMAAIRKSANGQAILELSQLDLRPNNKYDIVLTIKNVFLKKAGTYVFKAIYTTSKPEVLTSAGTGSETATLTVTKTISDFERIPDTAFQYDAPGETHASASFRWTPVNDASATAQLMQSEDGGKNWQALPVEIALRSGKTNIQALAKNKLHIFRLAVKDGAHAGFSNTAYYYPGKMDIKHFGVTGEDNQDNTGKINEAIEYLHQLGGGTLLFSKGTYSVRTVHLKSNVFLYVEKDAVIKAIKGADAPEATWFSDKKYRSGLSPTDTGPYDDPENYLTKQDVGHHYFHNTMFFGERLNNVKIIGNGLITGNGNLVTGDRVMNNAPDNRADKMFTFKLCTNIEIGGIPRKEDLWYDSTRDEPFYMGENGNVINNIDNMLNIERAGHFVLLATGTDNIYVHNTYFARYNSSNARDIYDFMGCRNVVVTNIYSKVSSDDIVKLGSDCSLGFTRAAGNYKVRNVIGDTNCNLFQIGSETADDITDVCVDNIYVLGANKAGFSISTNDGGHIKNIHLNCGHTGSLHSRSKMFRTFAPFFISISNRGRVLGAEAGKYSFTENNTKRNELLITNVSIGKVENISLNGIDVYEVYGGSSYNGTRWKPYDGTQKRATAIIAGYALPDPAAVEGGLNFTLPDGQHTGYIKNISFNDVHILVKGGNPLSDAESAPPELGVGQYNVSNLKVQPSYGLWARHVMGLSVTQSSFNYEKRDSRYAIFLDDVIGAKITHTKMVAPKDNHSVIRSKNSRDVIVENTIHYDDVWGSRN